MSYAGEHLRVIAPGPAAPRRLPPRRAWWRSAWMACWSALCHLAALRPIRGGSADVKRADHRAQTRLLGVRLTNRLRDQMRSAWLRIARSDSHSANR